MGVLARVRDDEVVANECHVLIGCCRSRWVHACARRAASAREHQLLSRVQREANLLGCLDAEPFELVTYRWRAPEHERSVRRDEPFFAVVLDAPLERVSATMALHKRQRPPTRHASRAAGRSDSYAPVEAVEGGRGEVQIHLLCDTWR